MGKGDNECDSSYGGNKYIISFNEGDNGNYNMHIKWNGKTKNKGGWFSRAFLLFLLQQVRPSFVSNEIACYTEHKRFGVIFRAHPSYRSTQEWYDWTYVKFYNEKKNMYSSYPSKICCFVKDEPISGNEGELMVIIRCAEKLACKESNDYLYPIVER